LVLSIDMGTGWLAGAGVAPTWGMGVGFGLGDSLILEVRGRGMTALPEPGKAGPIERTVAGTVGLSWRPSALFVRAGIGTAGLGRIPPGARALEQSTGLALEGAVGVTLLERGKWALEVELADSVGVYADETRHAVSFVTSHRARL
jgi:hypothetical protein